MAAELEKLRVAGTVGSSLDAEVEVFSKDEFLEKLKALGEELRFLLITSDAKVKRVSNAAGPPVGAIKVGRDRQGRRRLDPRAGVHRTEMRALLAPSPGCRVQCRAPDDLRALRGQCDRTGRISDASYERPCQPAAGADRESAGCGSPRSSSCLDQLSKPWIVQQPGSCGQSIELLPVFAILRTFNPGAAWSMFADAGGAQRWVFSALALGGVRCVLVYWLRRMALATQTLLATGLTLILGGAHRQCSSTACVSGTSSISSMRTGANRTSRRSTSPTPPSPSARRWWCSMRCANRGARRAAAQASKQAD